MKILCENTKELARFVEICHSIRVFDDCNNCAFRQFCGAAEGCVSDIDISEFVVMGGGDNDERR